MNLIQFLKETDECMNTMTREQMIYFIHEQARNLKETKREHFLLDLLEASQRNESMEKEGKKEKDIIKKEILKKIADIRKEIRAINSGEVCVTSEINEEYDDWYNSSVPEFLFEDPEGIFDKIKEACEIIHSCIDAEMYEEAYKLADDLIATEINVEGEYADCCDEWIELQELVSEKFLTIDYRKLVLNALYAAYQENKLEDRPQIFYDLICNSKCTNITLEEVIQQGNKELEQIPEFLRVWIEFLQIQSGAISKKLLREAVDLVGDASYLLEEARESVELHPELYLQLLEKCQKNKNWEDGIKIGQEAVKKIPSRYRMRGKCAILTSVFALQMKKTELAEEYWQKAFESDTTVVNYLRLITESKEADNYVERAKKISQDVYDRNGTSSYLYGRFDNPDLNTMSSNCYFSLKFLEGEWETVIQKAMQVREGVGWSMTFMKQGIALFCLALYYGKELQPGCREMLNLLTYSMNFKSEEYFSGLLKNEKVTDSELLWKCLLRWKEHFLLSEVEQKKIVTNLEQWVQLRVKGIMDGNHRKYYNECAAFIAAVGEVKEAGGEKNAKAAIMEEYRMLYPRRSAFHEELRVYGMVDTRKNNRR